MAQKKNQNKPNTMVELILNFLEQSGSESLEQAGESLVTINAQTAALAEWAKNTFGDKGITEGINGIVAGLHLYMEGLGAAKGWNPTSMRIMRALTDDFFDGIKEGIRATGKATPEVIKEAWNSAYRRHKTFVNAFQNLSREERAALLAGAEVFSRQNEASAALWKHTREQITDVRALKDLIGLGSSNEAWTMYLKQLYGEPPKKQEAVLPKKIKGFITETRAKSNELAAKINKTNKELDHALSHARNRKRFG